MLTINETFTDKEGTRLKTIKNAMDESWHDAIIEAFEYCFEHKSPLSVKLEKIEREE